jgi:hypothetical protein
MYKKLLSGPGASTKGAGVGPALCECVRQGFLFDYFVGVSYSSVIAIPLALGMHRVIEHQSTTVNHNDFFDKSPMTAKGKLSHHAIFRSIGSIFAPKKFNSFGVQNVQKLLKEFVTEDLFNKYQEGDYPIIYICAVSVSDREPVLWNIKDKENVDYQTYLDMVSASSRIPIWTQPQAVTYKGETKLYYDGGITDVNASSLVLDLHDDIKEVVSIYPGPKPTVAGASDEVLGITGAIEWTIDTMLRDVLSNDIIIEKDLCDHRGIELKQIFLPDVLKNLYDTDPERLLELKEKSIKEVQKHFKN